jgi:hypothetical protein
MMSASFFHFDVLYFQILTDDAFWRVLTRFFEGIGSATLVIKHIMKMNFPAAMRVALFLIPVAAPFSSLAVLPNPPGGLAVTPSGKDLKLSFPTTSPNYYVLQASPDLQQWTNCPQGVAGDGTLKSVTMSNAVSGSRGFYRYLVESPTSLILPQSTAFSILGYSCGGIQEQVAAGLDVSNGYPTGLVYLSTSCGGSGKDGGGHSTLHTATALVTWDFTGNVISATAYTTGTTLDPTTVADGFGDSVYNSGSLAYLGVPAPTVPTVLSVVQSGDQFQIAWAPHGVNPAAITSTTLTATPINSPAAVLTATVTGSATSGIITTLQPATIYRATVANTTIGGTGPASAPITLTTSAATIPPSAPTGVTASWSNPDPSGATDTLVASWQPAVPGNSPVDQYLVTIVGSDGGGTNTTTVSGTTYTTYFGVDYIPNWSVTVQAHNAAGWGPVSAVTKLGGL